jgi:hypothetical protein
MSSAITETATPRQPDASARSDLHFSFQVENARAFEFDTVADQPADRHFEALESHSLSKVADIGGSKRRGTDEESVSL